MSIKDETECLFPNQDTIWCLLDNVEVFDKTSAEFRNAVVLLPDITRCERDIVGYSQLLGAIDGANICKDYLIKVRKNLEDTLFFLDTYIQNAHRIKKEIINEYR